MKTITKGFGTTMAWWNSYEKKLLDDYVPYLFKIMWEN
jgi:hypothetical protein